MSATRERLLDFLRSHRVLTVAVVATDGGPHAATLFYAVDDDLCLYVLTDPGTRHGQVMAAAGLVAGTVQADRQAWRAIRGVQFRASCRALAGEERDRAWVVYTRRFPFLKVPRRGLGHALAKTVLWRLEPTWLRLVDNRRGFGHKEEWSRPGGTGERAGE